MERCQLLDEVLLDFETTKLPKTQESRAPQINLIQDFQQEQQLYQLDQDFEVIQSQDKVVLSRPPSPQFNKQYRNTYGNEQSVSDFCNSLIFGLKDSIDVRKNIQNNMLDRHVQFTSVNTKQKQKHVTKHLTIAKQQFRRDRASNDRNERDLKNFLVSREAEKLPAMKRSSPYRQNNDSGFLKQPYKSEPRLPVAARQSSIIPDSTKIRPITPQPPPKFQSKSINSSNSKGETRTSFKRTHLPSSSQSPSQPINQVKFKRNHVVKSAKLQQYTHSRNYSHNIKLNDSYKLAPLKNNQVNSFQFEQDKNQLINRLKLPMRSTSLDASKIEKLKLHKQNSRNNSTQNLKKKKIYNYGDKFVKISPSKMKLSQCSESQLIIDKSQNPAISMATFIAPDKPVLNINNCPNRTPSQQRRKKSVFKPDQIKLSDIKSRDVNNKFNLKHIQKNFLAAYEKIVGEKRNKKRSVMPNQMQNQNSNYLTKIEQSLANSQMNYKNDNHILSPKRSKQLIQPYKLKSLMKEDKNHLNLSKQNQEDAQSGAMHYNNNSNDYDDIYIDIQF